MVAVTDKSAPLIAVVGASGAQGSSVVRHLIAAERDYCIRALSRDTKRVQHFVDQGVEAYKVDLAVHNADAAKEAFAGADAVFLMTNWLEGMSREKEVGQGKMMIDAAIAAGVKLILWSGLPSVSETSNGTVTNAEHFDGKADITAYGREKVAGTSIDFVDVHAGSYLENLRPGGLLPPVKLSADTWEFKFPLAPDAPLPFIDLASDFGAWVVAVIELPHGKRPDTVRTFSQMTGAGHVVRAIAEASGAKVAYRQISVEERKAELVAAGLDEDSAAAFSDIFRAQSDFGYWGKGVGGTTDLVLPHKLATVEEYAQRQDWSGFFQ